MRTPSPPYAGSTLPDLWPTGSSLGSPHRLRPLLLRMPFGSRLATDTLPSEAPEEWLQVSLGLYPAFVFVPPRASPYLPLASASQAFTPLSDTALLIGAPEGLEPS